MSSNLIPWVSDIDPDQYAQNILKLIFSILHIDWPPLFLKPTLRINKKGYEISLQNQYRISSRIAFLHYPKCLCYLLLLMFCQQNYVQGALHFVNVKNIPFCQRVPAGPFVKDLLLQTDPFVKDLVIQMQKQAQVLLTGDAAKFYVYPSTSWVSLELLLQFCSCGQEQKSVLQNLLLCSCDGLCSLKTLCF